MDALNTFIDAVVRELVNPLITLLALAAFVLFVWGMVEFIRSAGDTEKLQTGKRHMVWGIVGLVIIFGAKAIIEFLGSLFNVSIPK